MKKWLSSKENAPLRQALLRWLPLIAAIVFLGIRLNSNGTFSAKPITSPPFSSEDGGSKVNADDGQSLKGAQGGAEDGFDIAEALPPAAGLEGATTPSNQLIIDSILSIIQHYYVAVGKTDNLSLIQGALEQITKDNHHYRLKKTERLWSLFFDDQEALGYEFGPDYTYDHLMQDILRSNAFLQANENATYEEPEDTSYFFLNHMLQALDRHSALLESENYRSLKQGTEGSFGGLGVIVSIRDHLLKVIEPIQGSPAKKAGIEKGDIIVAINDFLTFGAELEDIIEKMRGKPDTDVTLTILKEKTKEIKEIKVQRKVVKLYSVEDQIMRFKGQSVLNMKVNTFSTHTAEEIVSSLRKAERRTNGNLAGIVLDLRDNPGGLLDQAIEVSDIFLEQGEIIVTKGRETELESAKVGAYENSLPMVVLINSQSASASEIVAGALKDNNRAIVIGEPSYGKGTVQTIFELPEERALKLTIAHYLTPSRVAIQDRGVKPHLWLARITPGSSEVAMNSIRLNSHSYYHTGKSYSGVLKHIPAEHRFYLPEAFSEQAVGKAQVTDPDLWSSLFLLSTLKTHYNSKGYAFDNRRATWFAKVRGLLENELMNFEQKNLATLADRNGVYWYKPQLSESCDFSKVQVSLAKRASEQKDQARIAVTVRNACGVPLDRISVYFKTNQEGYPYKELPIGRVMADTRLTKVMAIPLPVGDLEEPFEVSGVMVVDGLYTDKVSEWMRYLADPREKPKFATTASLKKGASSRQQTDPYTVITFDLENLSNYHMEELEAELINLSGGSMSVASPRATIYQLGTHGKKQVSFAVMGLDLASPSDAYLGLKIKTPYFRAPITKSVKIHGFPSKKISVIR